MFQRIARRLREARELGSYELIEQLGQGGMGEVWRARHRLLARQAAVKLVRPAVLGAGTEEHARLLLAASSARRKPPRDSVRRTVSASSTSA